MPPFACRNPTLAPSFKAQPSALEHALRLGQIRAHFQPQISAQTGALLGCEALARWHHPTRGLLSPADFLPEIDACGLTQRLGEVMVQSALTALRDWDRVGVHVPLVAVNFTQADLTRPNLPSLLAWELDRFALAPARLTIEILETVPSGPAQDGVAATIAELARMGCGVDLDDFGTGHATQAALKRFAVGRIKLDRRFVAEVNRDRYLQSDVAAIVAIAKTMRMQTLAEGVETPAELATLAALGCDAVQGFHIAPPMAASAMALWVTQHFTPKLCLGMTG